MRAEIDDTSFSHKHYGTLVTIYDDEGNNCGCVVVWLSPHLEKDYAPSPRELESWNEEEYGPYEICDNHYESTLAYKVSNLLMEAVNGHERST